MPLVKSHVDVRKNLEMFHSYLFSTRAKERKWARERLSWGKNFVAASLDGRVIFGPSRVMGYPDNNLKRHTSDRREGGSASDAIDRILVRITHGQPDWKAHEDLYLDLCDDRHANPKTYNKGNERSYWNLDCNSKSAELDISFYEGRRIPAFTMRTERSAAARAACLRHRDPTCVVCGFNFGVVYGEHGHGFIHIHHLKPLAQGPREVDLDKDLCPVCPNCHCMLHRNGGLLSPDELKNMMKRAKNFAT